MQTTIRNTRRNILAAIVLSFIPLFAVAGSQKDCGNEKSPAAEHGMQPPPDGLMRGMPPMGMQPPSPLDDLDLSEAQRKKIDTLMQAQFSLIHEKERTARKTMQALHQLGKAEDFDAVKAKTLTDTHGRAIGELLFLHAETRSKVSALLTAAQRRQLSEQTPCHPLR